MRAQHSVQTDLLELATDTHGDHGGQLTITDATETETMAHHRQTPRQQAIRLLDQYCGPTADDGWSAELGGYFFTVEAWSKPGTVFAATSAHTLTVQGMSAAEAWRDALRELRMGVEPCTLPDCEGCQD